MLENQIKNRGLIRLGGIAGIFAGIFLPGVILQIGVTNWFPEEALQSGTMTAWLNNISEQHILALSGITLSIFAIICFMFFALSLYRLLPKERWLTTAGFASHLAGIPLALAAFVFAFGFTWALVDLRAVSIGEDTKHLSSLAAFGMRGFLVGDDLATSLIGLGNGLFALSALQSKALPKWLCWWGVIAAILVWLVLLRYLIPAMAFASLGYPLVILWFVLTGIYLLRMSRN